MHSAQLRRVLRGRALSAAGPAVGATPSISGRRTAGRVTRAQVPERGGKRPSKSPSHPSCHLSHPRLTLACICALRNLPRHATTIHRTVVPRQPLPVPLGPRQQRRLTTNPGHRARRREPLLAILQCRRRELYTPALQRALQRRGGVLCPVEMGAVREHVLWDCLVWETLTFGSRTWFSPSPHKQRIMGPSHLTLHASLGVQRAQVIGIRGVFNWGGGMLLRRVHNRPLHRPTASQVRPRIQVSSPRTFWVACTQPWLPPVYYSLGSLLVMFGYVAFPSPPRAELPCRVAVC